MPQQLTYDETNGRWLLSQSVTTSGTITHILATENKFLDKNIAVQITTPAAGTASLAVTDNTTDVSVGTAAGGKYPLIATITGQMSYATGGWVTTSGQSAADSEVQVGTIDQSILQNGATTIASGSNITPASVDQTITITAGYEGTRTLIVKSIATGANAEATVSGTAAATAPTLANTASAQSNKTQITISPIISANLTNNSIDKYYIAVTPTAPATNLTFTKTINEAGYLGSIDQITASGSTTSSTSLYYIPLTTGTVSTTMDATTITPTMSSSSASVTNKTRVDAAPTKNTNNIGEFYIAVTATAPATTVNLTSTTTEGYVTSADVSATAGTTTQGTDTYYIPLSSGTKSAGSGSVSASSSSVDITEESSQPASGHYFSVTGSGTANIGAGWYNTATTQSSNNATKYYSLPEAVFGTSGGAVVATTAGYVDENTQVATVSAGSLSTGMTDKSSQGYNTLADSTVVIPTDENGNGGYLYMSAGYYGATQISLGTLIPDSDTTDAVSAKILSGYEAFTTDGKRLVGSIATYSGDYTTL